MACAPELPHWIVPHCPLPASSETAIGSCHRPQPAVHLQAMLECLMVCIFHHDKHTQCNLHVPTAFCAFAFRPNRVFISQIRTGRYDIDFHLSGAQVQEPILGQLECPLCNS